MHADSQKVSNKTTIETMAMADHGDELESFNNLEGLFNSWDDATTKEMELDSTIKQPSLEIKTKEKILTRLIEESRVKISRETNAADSQFSLWQRWHAQLNPYYISF